MPRTSTIGVFDYLDYRAYLRDFYVAKKESSPRFSFRSFARRAGLRAPNHLKRVMDGERNLAPATAVKYTKALGLDGERAAYFCDLVAFNQARTNDERNAAYQRLTGFRGYRKAHRLELAQAAYYSTWFVPAIREMVLRVDFREDPAWIASKLVPPITRDEAATALATLLELGLVERDDDGRLVQGEPVLTTGPETRGLHIVNFHRAMMERASGSMDIIDSASRDISSLTMCLGEDGLRRLKERIVRFRKEIIALATNEDEGDQVIQLNMQLFPLTTSRQEDQS